MQCLHDFFKHLEISWTLINLYIVYVYILHQTTTDLYMYVPVFVIDMDFYSLAIGLMVKPLFAKWTSL
jgi:hypothetical protein